MPGDLPFGIALRFSKHSLSEISPLQSCTSFGFKDALVCCDRKYMFASSNSSLEKFDVSGE